MKPNDRKFVIFYLIALGCIAGMVIIDFFVAFNRDYVLFGVVVFTILNFVFNFRQHYPKEVDYEPQLLEIDENGETVE